MLIISSTTLWEEEGEEGREERKERGRERKRALRASKKRRERKTTDSWVFQLNKKLLFSLNSSKSVFSQGDLPLLPFRPHTSAELPCSCFLFSFSQYFDLVFFLPQSVHYLELGFPWRPSATCPLPSTLGSPLTTLWKATLQKAYHSGREGFVSPRS